MQAKHASIDAWGRLTLPPEALVELGIGPGTYMRLRKVPEGLVLERISLQMPQKSHD